MGNSKIKILKFSPILLTLLTFCLAQDLPTNYEYFTESGIKSGITTNETHFFLNGKPFFIYSGSIHYFRIPKAYWRTRLRQLRAAGLNTVETYMPWNLHEPINGEFNFGEYSNSDMQDFLDLELFLKLAQEEDLFVILRPGPFISAEYNFGGFPSWLLRQNPMGFRTDEHNYNHYISRYFNYFLLKLFYYKFTKGGPIIAFQVENEYGYTNYKDFKPSKRYLGHLFQLYIDNDMSEFLVTSDNPIAEGDSGTLPGELFQTTNFGDSPENYLKRLSELQPNKPLMVMEFWIGWFDHWTDNHQTRDPKQTRDLYERILKYPASVNIYMFHGGSNFAFGNGAHLNNELLDNSAFLPITTSYDYDSPLDESGQYTQKYYDIKDLLTKYNPIKTKIPPMPEIKPKIAYPSIKITQQLPLYNVITDQPPMVLNSKNVIAMEMLDINHGSGQSYGYIVYRKDNIDLEANTVLKIEGHVCDTVMVLVNGVLVSPEFKTKADLDGFGFWRLKDSTLVLNTEPVKNATIDIVVEEWGRMHGGTIHQYNQTFKGLWQGNVYINDQQLLNWKIVPLEFKKAWNNVLTSWQTTTSSSGPALYLASLILDSDIRDTYIDMSNWTKGLVIVNGFPIGKYFKLGPQQAIYLPAPFLHSGENKIIIFEHFKASDEISFVTDPIYVTH
ncbi:unnamed protein product [Diabrotica balteata]|uniref:Beta-galactosidase n=1 Tax=Diabrotica balteata TaxID=107213 RepID=A0A9N9XE97_DIABA|nr:unnamed protein product [Diabrotica balteata]